MTTDVDSGILLGCCRSGLVILPYNSMVPTSLLDQPSPPSRELEQKLFPGFASETVATSGAKINLVRKSSGPPLLLLHRYPETHVTWHKIASQLADHFSVVLPDLRGYGDSSKPEGGDRHANYSFRAMARDQIETMRHFGHNHFFVAAHDRGARVAHRLCLDHPASVLKVCLMDIVPTLTMYRETNQEFATKYMWWFFLIQNAPLPQHMIGLDPEFFLKAQFKVQSRIPDSVTPEAMNEYIRCFSCTGTIQATCEDFRAAAGIDLEMDEEDDKAELRIVGPLHLLWGAQGTVGKLWNVPHTWRDKTSGLLTGTALDCGHLLQEERPGEVLNELLAFLR
jgi:haloacetate dehalogenase